jgi:hypothetical protein
VKAPAKLGRGFACRAVDPGNLTIATLERYARAVNAQLLLALRTER